MPRCMKLSRDNVFLRAVSGLNVIAFLGLSLGLMVSSLLMKKDYNVLMDQVSESLQSHILAIENLFHGIVIMVASNKILAPYHKSIFYYILCLAFLFITLAGLGSSLLYAKLLSRFHWMDPTDIFCFAISLTVSIGGIINLLAHGKYHKHLISIKSFPANRTVDLLTKSLLICASLEVLYIIIYLSSIMAVRWSSLEAEMQLMEHLPENCTVNTGSVALRLNSFFKSFVESYTMGIHRSFILGFAYTAALHHDAHKLFVFTFGNTAFTIYYVAVGISSVMNRAEYGSMPSWLILGQVLTKIPASVIAIVLWRYIQNYNAKVAEETPALMENEDGIQLYKNNNVLFDERVVEFEHFHKMIFNMKFTRFTRFKSLLIMLGIILLAITWELECLYLLYNESQSPHLTLSSITNSLGIALNFSIHGAIIFVLTYFGTLRRIENPRNPTQNTIMWLNFFFFVPCLIEAGVAIKTGFAVWWLYCLRAFCHFAVFTCVMWLAVRKVDGDKKETNKEENVKEMSDSDNVELSETRQENLEDITEIIHKQPEPEIIEKDDPHHIPKQEEDTNTINTKYRHERNWKKISIILVIVVSIIYGLVSVTAVFIEMNSIDTSMVHPHPLNFNTSDTLLCPNQTNTPTHFSILTHLGIGSKPHSYGLFFHAVFIGGGVGLMGTARSNPLLCEIYTAAQIHTFLTLLAYLILLLKAPTLPKDPWQILLGSLGLLIIFISAAAVAKFWSYIYKKENKAYRTYF